MIATFTGRDSELASDAAALLDHIGRQTPDCAVALHSFAAAEHLGNARPSKHAVDGNDRMLLSEALRLLAELSDATRRQDEVAEAIHRAMLAYLASR